MDTTCITVSCWTITVACLASAHTNFHHSILRHVRGTTVDTSHFNHVSSRCVGSGPFLWCDAREGACTFVLLTTTEEYRMFAVAYDCKTSSEDSGKQAQN